MKKKTVLEIAAFFAFTAVCLLSLVSFETDCKEVRNACLRLHVIANSDSEADQALKLKVRDSVLETARGYLEDAETKRQAQMAVLQNLDKIEEAAQATVFENGFDYSVKVEVGKSRFPTKTYEQFTLPAGVYDAVRVIIGSGNGKNWWCVMFPSLCLPAAKKDNEVQDVFSKEALKVITANPKYEIRFWVVEKIEQVKEHIEKEK